MDVAARMRSLLSSQPAQMARSSASRAWILSGNGSVTLLVGDWTGSLGGFFGF